MAITVVSSSGTTGAANATATSGTTSRRQSTHTSAVTAGNAILAIVAYRGNNNLDAGGILTSVDDSLGNSYTLIAASGSTANNDFARVRMAYCGSSASGTPTFNANFGVGLTGDHIGYGVEIYAIELNGMHATSAVVQLGTTSGGTATHTSATISTSDAEPHFLVCGTAVFMLGATDASYSAWTNSFTEVFDPTTGPTGFGVATRSVSSGTSGSWSTAATCSSANERHTAILALRGAADAGGVTGTLASTTGVPTLSASGSPVVAGTVASAAPAPTLAAGGSPIVAGSLSSTTDAPTLSASGSIGSAVSGTLAGTAPVPTLAASGTTAVVGTQASTAPAPTLAAAGTTAVVGSLASAAPTPTLAASGGPIGVVGGTLAATTPAATLAASGSPVVVGSLASTAPVPTLSAAGFMGTIESFTGGRLSIDAGNTELAIDAPATSLAIDAGATGLQLGDGMADFVMTKGDTKTIPITLTNDDGTPFDPSGSTVRIRIGKVGQTPILDALVTEVVSAAEGRMTYDYTATTAGTFVCSVRATLPDATFRTFPDDGILERVRVVAGLG